MEMGTIYQDSDTRKVKQLLHLQVLCVVNMLNHEHRGIVGIHLINSDFPAK